MARDVRLQRKGTISRARKAMESKGLGDLRNSEIIQQMEEKHPARRRHIGPDMYTFMPEEEVQLKVTKILGKMDNEATT